MESNKVFFRGSLEICSPKFAPYDLATASPLLRLSKFLTRVWLPKLPFGKVGGDEDDEIHETYDFLKPSCYIDRMIDISKANWFLTFFLLTC